MALRNLMRMQCPPTGAALDAHRRRHAHESSRIDRGGRMPSSAQKAFRDRVSTQARRLGFET